jgi:hypothetical protein
MKNPLKNLNEHLALPALILLSALIAAAVILFSCQKESSFSAPKGVIEPDHGLKPKEGYNLTKRVYVPQEAAKGKGRGKPKPPADTTGTDPQPPTTGNVLYLDMDGETVSTQYWNAGTVSPSGLTQVEQDSVYEKKRREYEPMGFTVTRDRSVYDKAPVGHRHMTIYTESWQWYGQAGGVAYVGGYKYDAPSFVFTSLLGYNAKYIADAGIHEVGHAFGLRHVPEPDGSSSYATYGNYMGVSYYVPRGFFESYVKDAYGGYVDQFAVIKSNL